METQSGARTPLVDPFGRELEAWLRDAPATRTPYLADLVVPPVTGPVQRPDLAVEAPAAAPADVQTVSVEAQDDTAFRRPRDRAARHAASCVPAFPEPPERLALRLEDLAVEVSASSGRTTIERIVILEDEVRRRDEDLARLAAWEATVAEHSDPEVEAARAFARTVFADLLADAAREADRRERAALRRAATGSTPTAPTVRRRAHVATAAVGATSPVVTVTPAAEPVAAVVPATSDRDVAVRPVLSLPVVSPVAATTRPTPLVQPATGPTVIDRAAFAAALTAHAGATASTPVVLPQAVALPAGPVDTAEADTAEAAEQPEAHAGWWARLVARILGAFGRR